MTTLLKRIGDATRAAFGVSDHATQEQVRSVAHYIDPATDEPFPYKLCRCGHPDSEHGRGVDRIAARPGALSGPCRNPGCSCSDYSFSHYGADTGTAEQCGGTVSATRPVV